MTATEGSEGGPQSKSESRPRLLVWRYMTCPTKNIFATLYFLLIKADRAIRADVYGQGPVHTDLRQNMSVERECRMGRHVYEASIQIFKLTLLEKGSS